MSTSKTHDVPSSLADAIARHRAHNDAHPQAKAIPRASVSVASLPATLKRINDERFGAERQTGAIARPPVTPFGVEQQAARERILAQCDSIIDRCYRGFLADDDERVTFARTVRDFLNGAPHATSAMRAAVDRMNNQQRGTSK
jgi:hypothetical protein